MAVGTVVAAPVAVEAAIAGAKERYDYHLSELKKAAVELDPSIKRWEASVSERDDLACRVLIAAFNWDDLNEKVHVHVDDGSPLLADDVTGTTAFADWQKSRTG